MWLTFAMREGKNREVKNVLGHLGLAVNRLIRVSFGPFQLGDLPEGAVDEVRTRHLREQLGERVADRGGVGFRGAGRGPGSSICRGAGAAREPGTPKPKGGQFPKGARTKDSGPRAKARVRNDKGKPAKPRRHGPDRLGEPERARHERKHGRRPFRGKPR